MKCYKLTLARIGKQENWAGWRIAGMSKDTPRQLLESFESFHGSKNHVVSSLNKAIEMYEIAEHRGNLFVSKIRLGTKDMLGRPSFTVQGIGFPFVENPNLYGRPEDFLKLSYNDLNFKLKKLYDENRALKQEYITGANVVTIHDSNFELNRSLSVEHIISRYFSNEEKLEGFVRAIFWVGNNEQTTLCLKVPKGYDEYFEMMYFVYSFLPISMRSSFSFRTYNLRNLSGVKIVFSEEIPVGKYYDIETGNNNIFTDNILNNSRKLTFIDYILEHIRDDSNKEYFELLQNSLEKMGQSNAVENNTIEMAHNMLMANNEDDTDLSDMEILKKFQEYVSLDYTNEVIDNSLVKYLGIIIQKGIQLNDTLMNKLEVKLKNTKYVPLIELGYEYKATKLLESGDKQKSFEFLYSIEDDSEVHEKYIKCILEFVEGPIFLDEYYGEFYLERMDNSIERLCAFYEKTKNLPEKTIIYRKINERAHTYSIECVQLMLKKHIDFNYQNHIDLLNQKLGLSSTSKTITDDMKRKYWSEFNFGEFDFNRINDYLTYLPYENWQINLIRGIKGVIDELNLQKPESVKRYNSYIRGQIVRGINLSPDVQDYLKKEFQKYCLEHANKTYSLDFWLEVAKLFSIQQYIRFIFINDIKVFTEPELFENEFPMSKLYERRNIDEDGSMQTYRNFCENFLRYIDSHGQYDELGRVLLRIQNADKGIRSSSFVVDDPTPSENWQDSNNSSGFRGIIQRSKEGVLGIFPGKKGKHLKSGKHGK